MRRQYLPPTALKTWADLNNIERNGVTVAPTLKGRGLGVLTTAEGLQNEAVLITVPLHLVLSLENVWIYAKSDQHLKQVLDSVGEYSQSARGAILIFLLMQITHSALAESERIGVSSALTEYVKFLPPVVPLPTFWSGEERALAAGTSLEAALESKLKSLDREFTNLHESTASIGWCWKYWWSTDTGILSFDDWKQVDAMYRSRALDLPGTGHAMVPYVDMANHASGEATTALYDTDADGNAILILREGKTPQVGDEVSITYGDDKGACEMLFSYGFIEDTGTSARELFLELDIPDDDPLKLAKKAVSNSAPGFKLASRDGSVRWEGDFVWLICTNEEDGLDFRLLQTTDGKKELRVFWKDDEIQDLSNLRALLEKERLWDVFHLRAVTTLQERVAQQLMALERSRVSTDLFKARVDGSTSPYQAILLLRKQEEKLMTQAYEEFEEKVWFESGPLATRDG
ncbi:MAG: hypothetical protein Q9177_004179 [Variospora cf. flavescens]